MIDDESAATASGGRRTVWHRAAISVPFEALSTQSPPFRRLIIGLLDLRSFFRWLPAGRTKDGGLIWHQTCPLGRNAMRGSACRDSVVLVDRPANTARSSAAYPGHFKGSLAVA